MSKRALGIINIEPSYVHVEGIEGDAVHIARRTQKRHSGERRKALSAGTLQSLFEPCVAQLLNDPCHRNKAEDRQRCHTVGIVFKRDAADIDEEPIAEIQAEHSPLELRGIL